MTQNPLDRPVWSSLSTCHGPLSQGGPKARRYADDVNLFGSAADDSPEALAALATLVQPGDQVFVLQVPEIRIPKGLCAVKTAIGVQMVLGQDSSASVDGEDVITLNDEDAADMLALATLTEPGPFLSRTHIMGCYLGVRIDGRLAAMAGERMRFDGYSEISGVCTHPDFRGHGLARRLSAAMADHIKKRGETPFLHAWKTNDAAITLYESLGFRHRSDVNVAALTRA